MLARYASLEPIEFCCPGHRGGRQTDRETVALLGEGAYRHDVTQVPDIDDLLNPQGPIAEAQALAATLWGARETHFLVNGTSSGIHAAMLAICQAGDVVTLPRAVHRCVVEGLILCGATPRWIDCEVDPMLGCAVPPAPASLRAAAQGARLLVLTRPTYHGDVAGLDALQGTLILVDEAWGAHLGLHPELPPSACRAGADVVVNSTHKTAGALSGGSMLHLCTSRVDAERLATAARLVTTTSAWYGTLASLDGARRDLATGGHGRIARILAATRSAREELAAIPGIDVAGPSRADAFEGVAAFDETRLAFSAARRGWSGVALADAMRRDARVQVEMADARCVVAQVSGDADIAALPALIAAVRSARVERGKIDATPSWPAPEVAMTPREAWQAPHVRVPLEEARGRVAAEMVCPYPPGMAVLSFGERITDEIFEVLIALRARGGRLQGCDPTLTTLRVIR